MAKYIDRDALVDWLKRIPLKDLSDGRGLCRVIMEEDFAKAIKNIPKGIIVDVAPVRQAHWNYRCPIDGNSYRYCSKCLSAVYDNVLYVSKNYCPNCGAKMR